MWLPRQCAHNVSFSEFLSDFEWILNMAFHYKKHYIFANTIIVDQINVKKFIMIPERKFHQNLYCALFGPRRTFLASILFF
jgi:hypothetical protein